MPDPPSDQANQLELWERICQLLLLTSIVAIYYYSAQSLILDCRGDGGIMLGVLTMRNVLLYVSRIAETLLCCTCTAELVLQVLQSLTVYLSADRWLRDPRQTENEKSTRWYVQHTALFWYTVCQSCVCLSVLLTVWLLSVLSVMLCC